MSNVAVTHPSRFVYRNGPQFQRDYGAMQGACCRCEKTEFWLWRMHTSKVLIVCKNCGHIDDAKTVMFQFNFSEDL